jgi:hypothetical protein
MLAATVLAGCGAYTYTGGRGDKETGRQGDRETRGDGDKEKR